MRLEDINLRNPITIAYYDPFSVFPEIESEFSSKFPLSNLHWKYNPLKPGKSIPLLPVKLREEVPPLQLKKSNSNLLIADDVYLRLMFVKADNVEMYRSQVRPLITAWLDFLVKGKDVTWAIVLVIPSTKRDKPSTLIKLSIFDKIRADFGKSGKHLVLLGMAQLDSESSREDLESNDLGNIFKIRALYADEYMKIQEYNEVISLIKNLVLQTFDGRYTTYNEKIDYLLTRAKADSEARVSLYLQKLKLAYLMSDMRYLQESLETHNELFEDLKALVSGSGHAFDKTVLNLPKCDLKNFSPESTFNHNDLMSQFANYTRENVPINLFNAKLGLFLGTSLLLQSLANFASSISISSRYILEILQKLSNFINEVQRNYQNSLQLSVWFCAMIDFHLELPLTKKLMELNEQQQDSAEIDRTSAILEYLAELKLLRRTIVSKLAQKKSFKLPQIDLILEDVSLEFDTDQNGEFKLTYEPLNDQLKSQRSFEDFFEALTISTIQDLVKCERNKTIDVLSVDLAVLHYQREEYEEALEILLTSHEYFIENNWNYLGGALLEVYLECIQKVKSYSHEDVLISHFKLLATLKGGTNNKFGINNFTLVKNKEQRLALFQTIHDESLVLEKTLRLPILELFSIETPNFIDTSVECGDLYATSIVVNNPFEVDMKFKEVKLVLENEKTEIIFSAGNVTLGSGKQEVTLTTPIFHRGRFHVGAMELHVTEKLIFEQKCRPDQADDTVIHRSEAASKTLELSDCDAIEMYPVPGKFRVEANSPLKIELGIAKFDLVVHSGQKKVESLQVSLSSSTEGVKFTKDKPKFQIEQLEASQELSKPVTFDYFGDTKMLDFQIDVNYKIDGKTYEYHTIETYDMSLMISISVRDIFRTSSIYSKFQIGSVSPKIPVRVLDCKFESSDNTYIISQLSVPITGCEPLLVFAEQPAFAFYKLEPKSGKVSASDVLDLTITYSNLQSECEKLAQHYLFGKLAQSGLEQYFYAVILCTNSLKFNLVHYALNQELEILETDETLLLFQQKIRKFVPLHDAEKLRNILTDTFQNKQLNIDTSDFNEIQQLHIPVAVPSLGIFHKLEFHFDRKQNYFVGEPIEATLEIQSTSKWSSHQLQEILAASSPTRDDVQPKKETTPFQISILGEEQWLITGFKKHQFDVKGENCCSKFDICLVPLNVGALQLPKVNIKPIGNLEHHMEIVSENALETILVMPELDSITFSF